MNIDFKLPELGENIHSGDVVNVLVHEGQQIVHLVARYSLSGNNPGYARKGTELLISNRTLRPPAAC